MIKMKKMAKENLRRMEIKRMIRRRKNLFIQRKRKMINRRLKKLMVLLRHILQTNTI